MNDIVEHDVHLKTAWYYDESFYFARLSLNEEKELTIISYIRASEHARTVPLPSARVPIGMRG
jgi:hypothetical protein